MTLTITPSTMTPTRRVMLVAGIATVAVSLLLSIAPALARNGNSGTVKVHEAATGTETTANDPTVCSFWVSFTDPNAAETGSWQLLDWAPTGNGSLVTSGTYDTTGDGEDVTDILAPAAGHYRFEWTASGAANSKNKTLWIGDDCRSAPVAESASPTPSAAESVAEQSPSDSPAGEDPTPTPSASSAAESASPTPSAAESVAEESPASTDPSSSEPEQQVLGGRSPGAPSSLPDTATGGQLTGLLAAIGVLLIVAAHAATRRSKLPERA